MTAIHMPSTVPLQQNPNMGDFVHLTAAGDMGANGRSFHYTFRHNSSLRRYDQHEEQSRPQQQRETDLLFQRHLENKSKKKYTNNKQTTSETIGVNHVKVKSEMACGTSDANRNNTTKTNERKRSFHESSGLDSFPHDQDTTSQPSYNASTHASPDERLAKKQCTEISLKIVHKPNNKTNLKVTTTIQSDSPEGKAENGIQSHSNQQFSSVSSIVDIRQEEGGNKQSTQDDLLGPSSEFGDILEGLGKSTGENPDIMKVIDQGDWEKLMKECDGNFQDMEQMLTKIIDETNQELEQCSVPVGNLSNQEKGEVKEEGVKPVPSEGSQTTLKTEHIQRNMDPTRLEPPPNMSVTDAFPETQPLPSIHELKKQTSSPAMPPSSVFSQPLKLEHNTSQSVPSAGLYPGHINTTANMPRGMGAAASAALSDMAVSSAGNQQVGIQRGGIGQQQPNINVSTMNQPGGLYPNAQFTGNQQSSSMPHINSMNNFSSPSTPSNNLAQILKGGVPSGGNTCLPSLSNAFQKVPIRPGGPVNNSTFMPSGKAPTLGGYPNRITQEQYAKLIMHKRKMLMQQQQRQQQLQQQQQQQSMNPLIRSPPPPYSKLPPGAANMGYPRGMGRTMGMQPRMNMGGVPPDSLNTAIHLGNPQTLQHAQHQMSPQMVAQHARMRQMLQPGVQMATSRLQNMMRPTRMGQRGNMVGQDQMMSQMSMQQQHPMRRNAMGNMMNSMIQQQMNPGHPNMGANDPWHGPVPSMNSMQTMQQQPQQGQGGMNLQPNGGINQFQGLNGSNTLQTVVNVQTSQNTPSQNINIQTSVQTHTVLHQPQQQQGYNPVMNNQRLLQLQQQSRMNRATGGTMPAMGGIPPTGNMMMNAAATATGRPQNTVQSSSQMDLDLLDNIIRKDP